MVFINGKMVDLIKAIGKMENNMVKEFILIKKENRNQGYGKMEKKNLLRIIMIKLLYHEINEFFFYFCLFGDMINL